MQTITSAANPLLKDIRKAQEQGRATAAGLLVAEGPHLLDEALRSELPIRLLVIADGTAHAQYKANRVVTVPDAVFRTIAGTGTPQGLLGLVEPPPRSLAGVLQAGFVLVLDGIQDPGNAGTIARAAEAFGAGLLFVKGAVNPDHPKVLRASAGSLFRVPCFRSGDAAETLSILSGSGPLWAAVTGTAGVPFLADIDLTPPCAVVIGSEGRGVSPPLRSAARLFTIPTRGVESLNAAMAATVILYEAAAKRRK